MPRRPSSRRKPTRDALLRTTGGPQVQVYLTPEQERALDARLARIEGHLAAVRRMLAEHQDCNSLLVQLAAVKSALNQAILMLLESHMEACIIACAMDAESRSALEGLKEAMAIVLRKT
ncbi:MAG: metal-sensitive transcriptional regulator [Thermoflexus sp.]|jgi:DNA-binding FrmR family transcriptional regulator|uniref:metal-sensitive transcriptional regulator n=1 Tax=Thermoflexus TaxID=1495649 RepID=UPI001C7494DE|nr:MULTISPECIES: metal-sensitive transcriptional regulator [Thermoflexus]MDT7885267.1 metal-sensitive transcriptional regulator [Thermoflexus sp.]MDT7949240.1 metal-sensitive transcriptional regulator [Thermoflexus sp.]QWK09987.1 MAG: metal-sensing transcriptional repressor [Thermoflexus hugenholtzii]